MGVEFWLYHRSYWICMIHLPIYFRLPHSHWGIRIIAPMPVMKLFLNDFDKSVQGLSCYEIKRHANRVLTHSDSDKIDDLVQERRNSSALAMGLRFSCTNPSKLLPLCRCHFQINSPVRKLLHRVSNFPEFHFSPRVQLTIVQQWSRWWFGIEQATSYNRNQLWSTLLEHECATWSRWVDVCLSPKCLFTHEFEGRLYIYIYTLLYIKVYTSS